MLVSASNQTDINLAAGVETDLLTGGTTGLAVNNADEIVVSIKETGNSNPINTIKVYVSSGISGGLLLAWSQTYSCNAGSGKRIVIAGYRGGPIRVTGTSTSGATASCDCACMVSGNPLPNEQVEIDGVVQGGGTGGVVSGNLSQSGGTVAINATGTVAIDGSSSVTIGGTNATSVSIGSASVPDAHPGGMTVGAGKSIAGGAGNLTVDTTGTLSIGPTNATAVAIGSASVADSHPGGMTVAANKAITGAGAMAVEAAGASTLTVGGASNAVALGQAAKTTTVAGALVLSQNLALHATRPAAGAFPYSALATDCYIGVTDTTAARVVTLPDAATVPANTVFIVKDESGGATTHNITVKATTSTLDGTAGATGVAISTNYGVQRWISDGTNYFSI